MGLRAILPVYKTTPLPILHREAGIPPVTLILQEIRLRQALRIQTLDEPHPLKRRAYGKSMTRLTEMAKLLPRSVDSENTMLNSAVHTATSEINSSIHDIHLFIDRARNPDGKAGGGYVLYQAGQRVLTGSFCINRNVEVIDTKIIKISQELSVCMQKALTKFATNILIYSDSIIAVGIVNGNYTLTSRTETKRIRDIQRDWGKRERLPHV
ncbi:hypothetical protein EPUL_006581, partial [Erysiphe pulchra]